MARVEATLTSIQNEQLESLAEELEMPKGQIVSEALSLLVKAIAETKCGRRVAIVDPATNETVYAYTSPALSQVEWVTKRTVLPRDQFAAVAEMVASPAPPNEALKRAMKRQK